MKRAKKRIAVIGGGITGLVTAYRIKQQIIEEKLPFELILLESSIKLGGKIYTIKSGDNYFDLGAESIDIRYPEAMDLMKELGLMDQLIYSEGNKPDIFFYNKLYSLDYPTYKGIPVRKMDIWKNNLLTFHGKIASFKDTLFPIKPLEKDVEMSVYLKKRFGEELVEHIVEPFFSKIYASDLDEMGIKSSKEVIYSLEQKYGRLSKGLKSHPELLDGSGNYVTFQKGLATLTDKLTEILKPNIQTSKKVFEINQGIEGTYVIDVNQTEQVRVGAICIATPVTEYSRLIKNETFGQIFDQVETASIGYILFKFKKKAIKNEPKGFGVVTPRRSDSFVTSIVFLNKKWSFLKDEEDVFIGVSFGRKGEDILVSLSNKEIEESILKDLEMILGITEKPINRIVKRWPDAIPQYTVTQEEKTKEMIELLTHEYPGIYISGIGLEGFGINQCISQANKTSKKIVEYVKEQNCIYSK
ncbi:protoporphyrinogen oxidase [Carnobacterium pleistocenium]|uniref:protoporphyrinogen oxidase n=1 Tax=Carnobacterium pleistocenium TaxID=181073 RepID=UPI000550CFFD|nr:protoporphyrinogen oxidase [Carnobacterium pleistocenium]